MARVGKLVASLRFFGDDLDPDEISRLLACEPTKVIRKGQPVSRRSKNLRKESGWMFDSRMPKSASLDENIADLLSRVSLDEATWRGLARYQPDIFVGVFLTGSIQGDSISPANAFLFGKLGIRLLLDIYSQCD